MAKLTDVLIGVGTTANDKKGDSLRAAFQKVNVGFTDLYTKLGLVDGSGLNLGAFTFTGSTMSTDDSTNIVIDKPITVNGEITVDGDITPKTNFGASLGTPTKQFKSLYVSSNTIFIGGFPISVDGSGNLVVNNGAGGGEFSHLEVEGTLEITKNNREGTVALSVTSSFDTGRLGAGQLVFEGNHPTYGIIPSNDDHYSLGNPAFGWSTVYTHAIDFANGTQQNSAGVEIYDANTSSPYVVFPVITGGDQLQIVGAEVSTIAGNLALTSVADANIISNGSGAIPGGSKTWTFGADGSLTIPGDIRSEGNINIDINLSDSTLRRWQFGEDGNLETPGGIQVAGILKIDNGVHEKFQTKADATGIVTHDCSLGHIFYHTSPDALFTVNFTNLNLTSGYATALTLIIEQGGTGFIPNSVGIGGVIQTLNWQGNVTPTPSINRTDVVTFSIICTALNTYTVLGQLTGF